MLGGLYTNWIARSEKVQNASDDNKMMMITVIIVIIMTINQRGVSSGPCRAKVG
jgi:hypothetical protein